MKKILFLTSSTKPDHGYGVVSHHLINEISRTGKYSVFTKTSANDGLLSMRWSSKYSLLFNIIDTLRLARICKNKGVDLICCVTEHFSVVGLMLNFLFGTPYVIVAYGTYAVILPQYNKFFETAFKKAVKIACISRYTDRKMNESCKMLDSVVINLGVDKFSFSPSNFIEKENIVLFVGNGKPRKGFDLLFKAMLLVWKKNNLIKLFIVGNERSFSVEQREKIHDYQKQILILSDLTEKELIDLYRKSKVNVLPSQSFDRYFEGFGLIHLEANACGTYTIGCKNSGNEDAIMNENGILINPDDYEELSHQILKIIQREKYPEIDVQKVRSWEDCAREYQKLFNEAFDQQMSKPQ